MINECHRLKKKIGEWKKGIIHPKDTKMVETNEVYTKTHYN